MNFTVVVQIFAFLVSHKDTIKALILALQDLMPDAPGTSKAQAVKDFIAKALGIEASIEAAWPQVAPLFNLFVSLTKQPIK